MNCIVFDSERISHWVHEKAGGAPVPGDTSIAVENARGELLVGVSYDNFTGPGGTVFIHSRCDDRRAPSRLFYWMIFDYPFNQMKAASLRGIVLATNDAAKRVNIHLGFKEEARLANYFPEGDAILYVMHRVGCRWLALERRYPSLRKAA